MPDLKVSVQSLLTILFHPKDLGVAAAPVERALEGTGGHQLVAAQRPAGWRSEVPVEHVYESQGYRLIVRGRMDGVLGLGGDEAEEGDRDPDSDFDFDFDPDYDFDSQPEPDARRVTRDSRPRQIIIEEVKTTYQPLADLRLDRYPAHLAQLRVYLFFMAAAYPEREVAGRLTYLNLDDLSERSFSFVESIEAGRKFFTSLAEGYIARVREIDDWRGVRDESLAAWEFPFAERRAGQDELMDMVASAVEAERDLFIEAATGIGKTIAVLYPALKGLAGGGYRRVFFLTAKGQGKEILRATMARAREDGLRLRTVFIEAKERVCLHPGTDCGPAECPCARDYYSRAAEVLPQLLRLELITPEAVRETARRKQLCPFELSLDLSLFCDLIVGDYNYVFDPGVFLRRFFGPGGNRDSLFLVDEAHNLVHRGRDMYSAALDLGQVRRLADELGDLDMDLRRECVEIEAFFAGWQREMAAENRRGLLLPGLPEMMPPALERLSGAVERIFSRRPPADLRRKWRLFYFELLHLLRLAGDLGRDYAVYVLAGEDGGAALRLFCLNPGPALRKRLDGGRSAVFFSATLSPFEYFRDLLGGRLDALHLRLPSPFPQENRLYLHVPGIDTRYRARQETAWSLAQTAAAMVAAHPGNYLMFFPSYAYLNAVRPLVIELLRDRAAVHVQAPSMREEQRRRFLAQLTGTGSGRSNLGLAVLGGQFGEGIDLPGESLIGVCLVGPGLPQVNEEQELIRGYFQERNEQGFLYAYLIPGLIRIIQAAGRVFRGPEDRGVVILVDDRFRHEVYRELLPPDWFMPGREFSRDDYAKALREFWGG